MEAVSLAKMIANHGYIFTLPDCKLTVKDDGTYHRLQVSLTFHYLFVAVLSPRGAGSKASGHQTTGAEATNSWQNNRKKTKFTIFMRARGNCSCCLRSSGTPVKPWQTIKHCWSKIWGLPLQGLFDCLAKSQNIS